MEGMEKQLTAVEWLIQEWPILEAQLPQWLIEQAKEMEKEQIETAFEEGMFHHTNGLCPDEYYIETFKSE